MAAWQQPQPARNSEWAVGSPVRTTAGCRRHSDNPHQNQILA